MKRMITLLVVLAALPLASCGARAHIRANHGVNSANFHARQRVAAEPASGSPLGLDSEEAAIVQRTYRKSIGDPGGTASREPAARVLLIEEPSNGRAR
jgi:hypothetical protein